MADRDRIEEVLDAWRDRLMAIGGVHGVAIGLSKDRTHKVIRVYLDRNRMGQAAKIPERIEEFPVEIEARSGFRAF